MSRLVKVVLAGVLFSASLCYAAVAKISGTVTDLSGQPVANSTVIIENKATHRSVSVQTDEHGRFSVRNLKGNDYSVFVVADSAPDGFRLQLDDNSRKPDNGTTHKTTGRKVAFQAAREGH